MCVFLVLAESMEAAVTAVDVVAKLFVLFPTGRATCGEAESGLILVFFAGVTVFDEVTLELFPDADAEGFFLFVLRACDEGGCIGLMRAVFLRPRQEK